MATYAELDEHGIAESADVLPMPVGPQQPPFPPAPRTYEEKLGQDVARLQGLLAEAVRDAHRARSERDLMRERVSEPFGCALCGVEKRSHGRRYIGGAGMHAWERPSDGQVKARMLARRAARMPLDVEAPEVGALRVRVAELEAQRDRRRDRLVALQNDALNMRGTLSPNGEARKVPMPLGEALAPAVEWLVGRVAELERAFAEAPASYALMERAAGSADKLTRLLAPVQALREDAATEEPLLGGDELARAVRRELFGGGR